MGSVRNRAEACHPVGVETKRLDLSPFMPRQSDVFTVLLLKDMGERNILRTTSRVKFCLPIGRETLKKERLPLFLSWYTSVHD